MLHFPNPALNSSAEHTISWTVFKINWKMLVKVTVMSVFDPIPELIIPWSALCLLDCVWNHCMEDVEGCVKDPVLPVLFS